MMARSISTAHPLRGLGGGYEFEVPLLDGDHVTDDAGTGFVHTAPGHGLDDFDIWMDSARKIGALGIDTAIPYVVDDAGYYTDAAPGFDGARVIDDCRQEGRRQQPRHRGARRARHDGRARPRSSISIRIRWRSKKPVIFRNTPQWFVYMDRDIERQGQATRCAPARSPRSMRRSSTRPPARTACVR